MAKLTAKRVVLGIVAALLLAAVVPPLLNVNRYRGDVANAIARALGRNVTVGSVSLRVLPQPGFALSNLVVADDPSFSAEPVLLAQDVTASLRLSSLWRGRLEIAKLSLSYPSLNLVRRSDGRWNLESLLQRATHSQTAPTATRPESRPRFPYIEAEGGRINLKLGQEKKAYALSDADFALWLASEQQWRVRLSAQPVRTDDNLSDTGTVRLTGTFGAAGDVMDTPVALQLTLVNAQLGQFTRLIYGSDRGWRGALNGTLLLRGTPANLKASVSAAIDDFHRYDIYGGNTIRLGVECAAKLSATAQEMRDLACHSDVADGVMKAAGWARWKSADAGYGLTISAQSLSSGQLLLLARRMEKDLPGGLEARGKVNASLELSRDERLGALWHGEGSTEGLVLRADALPDPLEIGKVQFALTGAGTDRPQLPFSENESEGSGRMLSVASFPLQLGGSHAATAQAWLSPRGYHVLLQGDVDSARVLRLARALALPAPAADIRGAARVNFTVANTWEGGETPSVIGSASLRNVTARVNGLASPLTVRTGRLVVSPAAVSIRNATFALPELSLQASGWVSRPRRCWLTESSSRVERNSPCVLAFHLAADRLESDGLGRLLVAPKQHHPWYRLVRSRSSAVSPLMRMRAAGTVTVAAMKVKSVTARHVRADVQWNRGILNLERLRAQVWEGDHAGDLTADFRGESPAYQWNGELQQIAMQDLPAVQLQDSLQPGNWSQGRATLVGTLKASGSTGLQLRESLAGTLQVNWRKGVLQALALDGSGGPLRFRALHGTLDVHAGNVNVSDGWLQLPEGLYTLSGTATLARELKLRLTRVEERDPVREKPRDSLDAKSSAPPVHGAESYSITGQLDAPAVQRLSTVQTSSSPNASQQSEQKAEVLKPEAQKADAQKSDVQKELQKPGLPKKEARNRNAGRASTLAPSNRE